MKQATMKDIARKAGVTQPMVSYILNNNTKVKVKKETREKVLEIARECNYQPHFHARSLKTGRTQMVSISSISPNLSLAGFSNPYLSEVYSGLGAFFVKQGYQLIFHYYDQPQEPEALTDLANRRVVDGMVFILFSSQVGEFTTLHAPRLQKQGIPFVMIHSLQGPLDYPNVGLDCVQGGIIGTDHLLGHGYTDIGFVLPEQGVHHCENQLAGYKKALADKGMPCRPDREYRIPGITIKSGYLVADRIVRSGDKLPRAFYVSDEAMCHGMIKRFGEAGLRVPDDIALLSYGNRGTESCYINNLTTVYSRGRDKGLAAGRILLSLIEDTRDTDQTIILEPQLLTSKSCGCSDSYEIS